MYYGDRDFVSAEFTIQRNGFDIYILRQENDKRYQAIDFEYEELEKGAHPFVTPLSISREDAQQLFDDLWRAGLRPSTKDETPAKDDHIRDLRMIAFHALGMTK